MGQAMNRRSSSTSNSKRNIVFLLKLVAAICLLAGYIYHVLPQYENGYNASLIDKVERLESIDEPKIVLLGHSSLAFGIDSERIEEAFGMPVVNMGLHGGNGNAFHEEMAKYNVAQGDIYIICHSDYDDDNVIQDAMTAWSSIENHLNLWKILRVNDIGTMAKSFPIYLKHCLGYHSAGTGNQDPGGLYARSAFNEYGDVALLREGNQYTFEGEVVPPGIGDAAVDRINELNGYLARRGATLLVAGYPIGNGNVTAEAAEFEAFQEQLADRLDCPVISNYVDYMFDYRYFYDTNLHLNTEGVALRTGQLISDIKRWKSTGTDADMDMDEYADIIADDNLPHIDYMDQYLDALGKARDRYTIIISAGDGASAAMSEELRKGFQAIGLSADWPHRDGDGYVAVVEQGQLIAEEFGDEELEVSGTFDSGSMAYSITIGQRNQGGGSSILLNGQEYSRHAEGLNFVVYSNETHRILDEVVFYTCSPESKAMR